MLRNYFLIAIRNLRKNPGYSFINIAGLAAGMAVSLLIGLWIRDELTFNQYHKNYDRIAQLWQHNLINGTKGTWTSMPGVMAEEVRTTYGSDFKHVLQSSWNSSHILTHGEKKMSKTGSYFEPGVIEMLSLNMLHGTKDALKDPYAIVLSASTAKAYFGDADPIGQMLRVDDKGDVKVTGVYEDIPPNSHFRDVNYLLTWELYLITNDWVRNMKNPWGSNFSQTFVQIADNADMEKVSAKIVDVKYNKLTSDDERKYKPEVFLHPMSRWRLHSEFKNGVNTNGLIEFV